jgi:glucan phosphoethanolaminetransferase (alkaline phosphatase superfamily)
VTLADFIIHQQFRFELGVSKIGFYVTLVSFGMMLATMLTVKGIFFPVWAIVPLAGSLLLGLLAFGYYLETYDVIDRLNTHMNTNNPQFLELLESIDRIEKKVDKWEKK